MTVSTAAGQHTLRERNLALVAKEIFAAPEPISRATVATRTGLTRATVSSLVDLLVDAHIIAELDPVFSKKAGRPAVPLTPASGTFFGIGLEVNVSYLGGTIVDLTGKELARITVPGDFRASDPTVVMKQLAHIATDLVAKATTQHRVPGKSTPVIAGVNIALPGLIDPNKSSLRVAPNLEWENLDPIDTSAINAALDPIAGRPVDVKIGNEANYGGLAQIAFGKLSTFIYVSAEVGIGSAILLEGDVFLGRRGWSGELGHVSVDPNGPQCSCGSRGCLEQYAGLAALLHTAELPSTATIDDLLEQLRNNDPRAQAAVHAAGQALGLALSDYINLIDIHLVVLGGIFLDLAEYLIPHVDAVLKEHVLSARWSNITVVPGVVGTGASFLGAASEVTRGVYSEPTRWVNAPAE
ncbi:ROK family protein [Timonella sp. A28]|uniref:ROK family protein n=1 Tax=Timonella sp. A28 TaxID=3442640 RepID=UPI003EBDDBB4